LDFPNGEISILLVDDPQISKLNQEYLNRKGPTNVSDFSHLNPQLLGDVVISLDTAARESADAGLKIQKRFNELLVHGILHLFGYEHDTSEQSAQIMKEKTQELLKIIQDT
jgi:probable rRNA maturation factor